MVKEIVYVYMRVNITSSLRHVCLSFPEGAGSAWVTDMGEASAYKCNRLLQQCILSDAVKKTHVEKDFIAFKSSTPRK